MATDMEQGVRGSPYTILVCGTDPRERRKARRALAARFREQAVVGEQPLSVSELKGIKLRGPKTDLALLVHFSEGRVLLTDKVTMHCSNWQLNTAASILVTAVHSAHTQSIGEITCPACCQRLHCQAAHTHTGGPLRSRFNLGAGATTSCAGGESRLAR
eukprot:TRINITY_DN7343_c0_g2_i2.p2 TRINITY_DN7343_c0_g2~~TRINITY_DN7343_c0_g2_i2.p2  ORF type:complete len:159 (-),score=0.58 TRINITY_DN7343_c0_g2_i2:2170-2646(-)